MAREKDRKRTPVCPNYILFYITDLQHYTNTTDAHHTGVTCKFIYIKILTQKKFLSKDLELNKTIILPLYA